MRVFLASEFRCTIYEDKFYLAPKAYDIHRRYSESFGDIVLCSRFESTTKLKSGYKEANFIVDTICIESLKKVLLGYYNDTMEEAMKSCDLVVLRIPSIIAFSAFDCVKKLKKLYFAEIMGDAWDSYWNHSLLGKLIAPYMNMKMEKVVLNADYALYVTEEYLQKKYPCKNESVSASNVVIEGLDPSVLDKRIAKISKMFKSNQIALMTSAAVDVKAKGHEYVIEAIKKLNSKGYKIKYYLAGGGKQDRLRSIAKKNGVENQIVFLGELPMGKVYQYIDDTDIYIQPSLQEGLPRAVIEAMSRACPCLGSMTAGTPELLDEKCIFKRKSSEAIVDAIEWFVDQDLTEYAKANFIRASYFVNDTLNERRNAYFSYVIEDIKKRSGRIKNE